MAQQFIVTTPVNSGNGTPLANAFNICNNNFSELYSRVQTNPPATLVGSPGDTAGMYAYDAVYFYYCFADYDGSSFIWGQVTQAGNVTNTQLQFGNTLVDIPSANANVQISVAGTANVAVFNNAVITTVVPISVSGNVTANNFLTSGIVSATGDMFGANVTAMGNLTAGNVNTAGTLTVTGNVTGGFFSGNGAGLTGVIATGNVGAATQLANGTSVLNIPTADGNIIGNISGTTGVFLLSNIGLEIAGVISASGNITGGNLRTSGQVTATGNITGGNITTVGNVTGNYFIGNGSQLTNLTVSISGNLGGNLQGNGFGANNFTFVSATGNVTAGNLVTTGILQASGANFSAAIQMNNFSINNVQGITISDPGVGEGIQWLLGNDWEIFESPNTFTNTGGNLQFTSGNISNVSNTAAYTRVTFNTLGQVEIPVADGTAPLKINSITEVANLNVEFVQGYSPSISSSANTLVARNSASGISVGQANVTNLVASGFISATGNIISSNGFAADTFVSAIGNVTGGNIRTAGLITATGNIQGGNIRTAGLITATGNITGGNLITGGNIFDTGALVINTGSNGNLTLSPNGTGVVIITKDLLNGQANGVGNIGNATGYFNQIFATATTALYADLAECYLADQAFAPGTVVMFGGDQEITRCDTEASPLIAGVVSTRPAYQMNSGLTGEYVTPVALVGRVPCQVQGPVTRGAMMVSAGNGRARAESNPTLGTVLGKALESFDGALGTIEIVVGRL